MEPAPPVTTRMAEDPPLPPESGGAPDLEPIVAARSPLVGWFADNGASGPRARAATARVAHRPPEPCRARPGQSLRCR